MSEVTGYNRFDACSKCTEYCRDYADKEDGVNGITCWKCTKGIFPEFVSRNGSMNTYFCPSFDKKADMQEYRRDRERACQNLSLVKKEDFHRLQEAYDRKSAKLKDYREQALRYYCLSRQYGCNVDCQQKGETGYKHCPIAVNAVDGNGAGLTCKECRHWEGYCGRTTWAVNQDAVIPIEGCYSLQNGFGGFEPKEN